MNDEWGAGTGVVIDDGAVIARSRQHPEEFAVLFRRHAGPLKRYVVRRIGPDAAEDVIAETFSRGVPAAGWVRPGPA